MDLEGEVVDVHVYLVEARRRHGQAPGHQPVDPDHAAVAGLEGNLRRVYQTARAHVIRLGALANLARLDVGVDAAGPGQ